MGHFAEPTTDASKISFQMAALSSYIKELKATFEKIISSASEEMLEKINETRDSIDKSKKLEDSIRKEYEKAQEDFKVARDEYEAADAAYEKAEDDGADPELLAKLEEVQNKANETLDKAAQFLNDMEIQLEEGLKEAVVIVNDAHEKLNDLLDKSIEYATSKIDDAKSESKEFASQVKDYETNLDENTEQRSNLKDKMSALEEDHVTNLEERQAKHEVEVSQLKKAIESASEEEVAKLKDKLEAMEDDFKASLAEDEKEYQSNVAEIEEKLKSLEGDAKTFKENIESASDKSAAAEDEIKKFEDFLKNIFTPVLDFYLDRKDSGEEEVKSMEKHLAELEDTIKDLQNELASFKKQISDAEKTITENEEGVDFATTKIKEKEAEKAKTQTDIAEAQKQHEEEVTKLKEVIENAPEEEVADLKAKLEAITEDHNKYMEELNSIIAYCEKEIAYRKDQVTTLTEEIAKAKDTLSDASKQATESSEKLKSVESEVKDVSDNLSSIKNELDETKMYIDDLNVYSEVSPVIATILMAVGKGEGGGPGEGNEGTSLGNIIALHGGGGSGMGFSDVVQSAMGIGHGQANIVSPTGGYGADGSFTWLPVVDKEAGETTSNNDVADKSVDKIIDAMSEMEGNITLLGYSDGAAMIIAFLGRAQQRGLDVSRIKRVVFIKGYVEGERHQGLDFSEAEFVPFEGIQALIIAGQNDEGFYQSTLDAQEYFVEPSLRVIEGAGHEFEVANAADWIADAINNPAGVHPSAILKGAIAIQGYYPLFETQEEANAHGTMGTSHVHTFEGDPSNYYMPIGLVMEGEGQNGWHGDFPVLNWNPTDDDVVAGGEADPSEFNCDEYNELSKLDDEMELTNEMIDKYAAAEKAWFEERGITQDDLGPDVEGIEEFEQIKNTQSKWLKRRVAIVECGYKFS